MSNVLTGLSPIIYDARDIVARELIGLIPAVTIDASAEAAALGQTVRSPVTLPTSLVAIAPNNVSPNTGSQTVLFKDLLLTNSFAAPIQWTGEEQRFVGAMFEKIVRDQFVQAFRSISNNVEASLVNTVLAGASRAVGTAGVTPFANTTGPGANPEDAANTAQVLDDNGCPSTDRHLIVNTTTYRNLASSPYLFKVNESGTDQLIRQGIVGELMGFDLHKSGQMRTKHISGLSSTAGAFETVGANNIGDTVISANASVAAASGGDVVTFAGDASQYVVANGAGSVLTLNNPGLFNTAISNATFQSVGNYTPNFGLHRAAVLLAARAPLMPAGGDAASDSMMIDDPVSGLVYQITAYRQYRQVHFEIGLVWGSVVIKSEFVTILMG
jgi:P22 coat protein - gene protein 5